MRRNEDISPEKPGVKTGDLIGGPGQAERLSYSQKLEHSFAAGITTPALA
jgi:hypothetical protein